MAFSSWFSLILVVIACWPNTISPTQSTVLDQWAKKEADVYFLLDSSSSIWIVDYRKMLDFVAELIKGMGIGLPNTRVGLGIFSVDYYPQIPIDNNLNKEGLINAVGETEYIFGNTYLSRAIYGLRTVGFAPGKARKGKPLIAVLITDGRSRYKQLTLANATLAKQEGISFFTIGVGTDVDRDELRSIASDPKTNFVWNVNNFGSLKHIQNKLSEKMAAVEFLQKDQKADCGRGKEADIIFVFDEFAIGQRETTQIKTFIGDVVTDLNVDSGIVRVGVVSKTCEGQEGNDINLETYLRKEDFKKGLQNNQQHKALANLLRRAWFSGFLESKGSRLQSIRRIVLFLTSKLPKDSDIINHAFQAKYRGIEIFVVRIGTDYDKNLLGKVASSPKHVSYFNNMNFLEKGTPQFFQEFCTGL